MADFINFLLVLWVFWRLETRLDRIDDALGIAEDDEEEVDLR